MERRSYPIDIVINGWPIKSVVIDPHYELKHSASIHDQLILELVESLDGLSVEPVASDPPFSYFSSRIELRGKTYRLIWLMEQNEIYVGVVNAYRRS